MRIPTAISVLIILIAGVSGILWYLLFINGDSQFHEVDLPPVASIAPLVPSSSVPAFVETSTPPTFSNETSSTASSSSSTATTSKSEVVTVTLSSREVKQGGTLFVEVTGTNGMPPRGEFMGNNLRFFDGGNTSTYRTMIGIDAKAKPGTYPMKIITKNGTQVKNVTIVDGGFAVTELTLTPELEEQGYTPSNIVQSIGEDENVQLQKSMEVGALNPYFEGPFANPLKKIDIVGNFGNIRKQGSSSLQHLGVDLEAKIGTPTYAMNDGEVVFQKEMRNYGKTIVIDHGLGIYSLYLHLSEFKVAMGADVKKGDLIGLTGNTGYSIDPHLHLSLKINGSSVDALEFIRVSQSLK